MEKVSVSLIAASPFFAKGDPARTLRNVRNLRGLSSLLHEGARVTNEGKFLRMAAKYPEYYKSSPIVRRMLELRTPGFTNSNVGSGGRFRPIKSKIGFGR